MCETPMSSRNRLPHYFSWTRWLKSWFDKPKKGKTFVKGPRLRLEELETRLAPATYIWDGGGGGNWSSGANWVGNAAPTGSTTTMDDLVFPPGVTQVNTSNDMVGATFN